MKKLGAKGKATLNFYLFILPWIVGFACFTVIPMASSLYFSFHNMSVISFVSVKPEFVAFGNYALVFRDTMFLRSIANTFYYSAVKTVVGLAIALLVAVLLNHRFHGNKVARTLVYLPAIIPMVAGTMLWSQLFSSDFSLLNWVLSWFGIPAVDWLGYRNAMGSVLLMSIWSGIGPSMLIFLAALQGVPQDIAEAARLDGCGPVRQFFVIVLPMISSTLLYLLITNLIGGLQAFAEQQLIIGIGTDKSLTMAWNVVLNAFNLDGFKTMGYASAQAWILFVIIMLFTLLFFKLSKKFVFYAGERD